MPNDTKLYIHLYHGRSDPDEQMEDWGSEGPVIGPFEFVQSTYTSHVRGYGEDCIEVWLPYFDDMLAFDGMFYGDFSIQLDVPTGAELISPEDARRKAREDARWLEAAREVQAERALRRARTKELPEIERRMNVVIELANSFKKLDRPDGGFPDDNDDLLELARAMCAAVTTE